MSVAVPVVRRIVDQDDYAALSDPAAATVGLRSLGTTATKACAGNDARLSDARTPTAHKTSHEPGGADAMTVNAAAGTGSLRTLGTTATVAAAGNDSRFPTTGEKAALPGSSGTVGASNKYLTQLDNALRVRQQLKRAANGILDETFPQANTISFSSPGLQVYVGGLVSLLNGQAVTGGVIAVGTLQVVTSAWLVLYRTSDNAQLAITADTPSLVGTAGRRSAAFTSVYTPTADETAWLGPLMVGGTAASLARGNNGLAAAFVGIGAGVSWYVQQTGQATPPATLTPAATSYPVWAAIY